MPYLPTNRSATPIRLFKSNVLEAFTHIHPVVVPVVWLPVIAYALSAQLVSPTLSWGAIAGALVVGLIVWTLAEYVIHRFVFHFAPKSPHPLVDRMIFLFHGVHHVQPQCKTRLVMPPVVSIPIAASFYALFTVVLGTLLGIPDWVAPSFAAFLVGYVIYDLTHYATHHFPMHWAPLKWLRRHHMLHHYRTPDARYGVSSPIWDAVFGTLPAHPGSTAPAAGN